jgi:hypothetical protein
VVATAEVVIPHSPMHTLAREQRKLAAILAADVVGYSRVPAEKSIHTVVDRRIG